MNVSGGSYHHVESQALGRLAHFIEIPRDYILAFNQSVYLF